LKQLKHRRLATEQLSVVDRFDPTRKYIAHLTFGAGPHVSLDMPLARMEKAFPLAGGVAGRDHARAFRPADQGLSLGSRMSGSS
jgi:hypothetical protein